MDQQVNPMFHQDRLMQHLGAHLVSFGEHSAQIELKIPSSIYKAIKPVTVR